MSRVNDVFSVNRLRQSWSQKNTEQKNNQSKEDDGSDSVKIMEVFENLKRIASERYSGEQMLPLNLIFESLKEKFEIKFKGDDTIRPDENKDSEVSAEPIVPEAEFNKADIIELLNTIEDIAEGFDCMRKQTGNY